MSSRHVPEGGHPAHYKPKSATVIDREMPAALGSLLSTSRPSPTCHGLAPPHRSQLPEDRAVELVGAAGQRSRPVRRAGLDEGRPASRRGPSARTVANERPMPEDAPVFAAVGPYRPILVPPPPDSSSRSRESNSATRSSSPPTCPRPRGRTSGGAVRGLWRSGAGASDRGSAAGRTDRVLPRPHPSIGARPWNYAWRGRHNSPDSTVKPNPCGSCQATCARCSGQHSAIQPTPELTISGV